MINMEKTSLPGEPGLELRQLTEQIVGIFQAPQVEKQLVVGDAAENRVLQAAQCQRQFIQLAQISAPQQCRFLLMALIY